MKRRIFLLSMPIMLLACFFVFGGSAWAAEYSFDLDYSCPSNSGVFGRDYVFHKFKPKANAIRGFIAQKLGATPWYLCKGTLDANNLLNNKNCENSTVVFQGVMQGKSIGGGYYEFILPRSYALEIGADYYFQTDGILSCFNYHNEHAISMCGVQADGTSPYCGYSDQGGFNGAGIKTIIAIDEPEPDPVIIVPGIMGSYNISGRWQIDPIFHTYDNLVEALIAAGYKENSLNEDKPTLFTFPYNWRADNNITANLLKEKIQQVKEISGRDKVDIIAHSMGGLVTRSYVEGSDYQNDIDQVVFLGTPHLGSPESYLKYEGAEFRGPRSWLQEYFFQTEAAINGYFDLVDYIKAQVLSAEQLLPIFDYLKDKQSDNSWLLRTYPLNYPQNNYLENLNNQANINILKQRVKITNIVSDLGGNSTLNNIKVIPDPDATDNKWQSGYPENLAINLDSLEMGNGDGTVPFNSANSLNGVETVMSGISDHENLPTIMQKEIIKSLTGKLPENYYNSRLTSTFKRWAFFRVYSPVDFNIIAPNGDKIGKDFNNNTEINEIPDAFYSGFNDHAEFVLIPNPIDGEYKVELKGVDNGGEYILAGSIINGNSEISKEFKGAIAPDQIREFSITYSAAPENPISDLEPIDTVPPVVIINKPTENEKYLHSDNLIVDYIATDDFSGLAITAIMIDDQILATTTIDLFDYSLGRHDLIIQASDKSGNQAQAQIKFEIIANIDSTISDIEEIHSRGWLKGRIYKPLLASAFRLLKIEAKYFEKEQASLEKLIRKTRDDKKLSDKQKQKLIEQYNKNLNKLKENRIKAIDKSLDAIVKLLNLVKKKNQINQAGYDIIINDINYLRNNL
ncbi:MAG: hypothetical protein PHF50_01520 [Patescibacteria group bacterium]|nr:hypothetical protein [Patescibacteria group bacterium]